MKNKIISTSIASFLQMAFMSVGSLLVTVFLTRILSTSEFGIVSLANTVVFFVVIVLSLGVPTSMARYLAKYENYDYYKNVIVSSVFVISPWLVIISLLFILSFQYFSVGILNIPQLEGFQYVLLIVVLLEVLRQFIIKVCHGSLNMPIAAKMSAYTSVAFILLIIPVAYFYESSYSVLLAKSVALFIPIMPIVFLLWNKLRNTKPVVNNEIVPTKTEILRYGIPITIVSFSGFGFLHADILFIAYYLNPESVAYYSVCVFVFLRLITIPRSLGNGLGPMFAKNSNIAANINYYVYSIILSMAFAFPIVIFLIINGSELLVLIFGEEYKNAYGPFAILGLYFFTSSILAIINPILDFSGKASIRAKAVFVGGIINIILNIILIPKYGLNGAAIATFIGYLVFFLIVFMSIEVIVRNTLLKSKLLHKMILIVFTITFALTYCVKNMLYDNSLLINAVFLTLCYPALLNYFDIVSFRKLLKKLL